MDCIKMFNISVTTIILLSKMALQIHSLSPLHNNIFKQTVEFLNTKNDLAIKSVLVFSNDLEYCFNNSFSPKDMMSISSVRNEPMPFSLIHISKNTTLIGWKKALKQDQNLIILCDLHSVKLFDKLAASNLIEGNYFDSNQLLLLVKFGEASLSHLEKKIMPTISKKLQFSSRVFMYTSNQTNGILSEMYRKCSNSSIIHSVIQNIYTCGSETVDEDFIWKRRKNLMGCPLRIAHVHDPPFFEEKGLTFSPTESEMTCFKSGNKNVCGKYVSLLKELVSLLNFTIEWVHAKDNAYGVFDPSTQKWNGAIKLINESRAEFSCLHFYVTLVRSFAVEFSSAISHTKSYLYMRIPESSSAWDTYTKVFGDKYWIILAFCTCFISGYACLLFTVHDKMKMWPHSSILQNLGSGVSSVGLAFASQEVSPVKSDGINRMTSTKCLFLVVCFFGMMNGLIYSGALVSFLLFKEVKPIINNLEDILQHKGHQLMVMKGTGCESYFKEAIHWPHTQIWNDLMMNNENALIQNRSKVNGKLMEDHNNVYFETAYEISLKSYPCNIMKSKVSYYHIPIAFPFRKNSPYRAMFGYYASSMIESGILECIGGDCKDVVAQAEQCTKSDPYIPINFQVVKFVFVVTTFGLFFSVVCCLMEKVASANFVMNSKKISK